VAETYEDDFCNATPRCNNIRQSFIRVFIYSSLAFIPLEVAFVDNRRME
jgi:hypothetical protein